MHNTDAFVLSLLTLHSYLVFDLNWYSSVYVWITLISAYVPLLIISINLIPLKATIIKFSFCNKLRRNQYEEIEEESTIDDDRDKLLHSHSIHLGRGMNDSSESN